MRKVIIESANGTVSVVERDEPIVLTEAEVKERVKLTSKIDVNELLKRGYVEAQKFHRDLENGYIPVVDD